MERFFSFTFNSIKNIFLCGPCHDNDELNKKENYPISSSRLNVMRFCCQYLNLPIHNSYRQFSKKQNVIPNEDITSQSLTWFMEKKLFILIQ